MPGTRKFKQSPRSVRPEETAPPSPHLQIALTACDESLGQASASLHRHLSAASISPDMQQSPAAADCFRSLHSFTA